MFVSPGQNADDYEYVEIFNRSCDDVNAINLSGYQLRASTGSTLGTVIYTFPAGTTIDAGQYYLVGGPVLYPHARNRSSG